LPPVSAHTVEKTAETVGAAPDPRQLSLPVPSTPPAASEAADEPASADGESDVHADVVSEVEGTLRT
jgi:hypothetical protein